MCCLLPWSVLVGGWRPGAPPHTKRTGQVWQVEIALPTVGNSVTNHGLVGQRMCCCTGLDVHTNPGLWEILVGACKCTLQGIPVRLFVLSKPLNLMSWIYESRHVDGFCL